MDISKTPWILFVLHVNCQRISILIRERTNKVQFVTLAVISLSASNFRSIFLDYFRNIYLCIHLSSMSVSNYNIVFFLCFLAKKLISAAGFSKGNPLYSKRYLSSSGAFLKLQTSKYHFPLRTNSLVPF